MTGKRYRRKPRTAHGAPAARSSPPPKKAPTPRPGSGGVRRAALLGFDSSRTFWCLWLLTALLRVATLTRHAVWYDELLGARDATNVLGGLLETSHWLHFFFLRFGLYLDDGALGLRLFPLLFGVATFPFVYALGNIIAKRAGAMAMGLLFAVSQYHIYYSQDGNYYAEVMFYAVLAAYLVAAGVNARLLWVVCLSPIPLVLSFFTHPFSGLGGALMLLAAAAVVLIDFRLLLQVGRPIAFFRRHPFLLILFLSIIAAAVAGAIGAHIYALRKMGIDHLSFIRLNYRWALKSIRFASSAWNMEFNLYFFTRTLRELGPSYIFEGALVHCASFFYFVLWCLGIVFFIRKRCALCLLFLVPFVGTYLFLFNFNPNRFFHLRYASYLCPFYLMGVGVGALELSRLFRGSGPARGGPSLLARISPALLAVALTLPSLAQYFFRDGENWKKIARYLQPRLTEKSAVSYFNQREKLQADFYIREFDLPKAAFYPARHRKPRQTRIALERIKRLAATRPDSWFLTSWYERSPMQVSDLLVAAEVTAWVRGHFIKVLEAPSSGEVNPIPAYRNDLRAQREKDPPIQSAVLYRWRYPERYLYAPYPLRIDLTGPPAFQGPRDEKIDFSSLLEIREESGATLWNFPLLVETQGLYRVKAEGKVPGPDAKLQIRIGGRLVGDFQGRELENFYERGVPIGLTQGLGKWEVFWRGGMPGIESGAAPQALHIAPFWERSFSVPALHFDFLPESETLAVVNPKEGAYLRIRNDRMVRYRIEIDKAGRYQLFVNARHDKPGPVIFEVRLDETLRGVLLFGKQNNEWGTKGFPLHLEAGAHTIDFIFLNEMEQDLDQKPDDDNDLFLRAFSLAALGDSKGYDDREDIAKSLMPPPLYLENGFYDFVPGSTAIPRDDKMAWWRLDPEKALEKGYIVIEPGEPGHSPIIRLNSAAHRKPVNIFTQLFPVRPDQLIYFSVRVRCENLYTHTTNAQVWYFDARGDRAGLDWVNGEGMLGTQPWERWSFVVSPPQTAASAWVVFSIFVQGNPRLWIPGAAYYQDFEWCVPPPPAEK